MDKKRTDSPRHLSHVYQIEYEGLKDYLKNELKPVLDAKSMKSSHHLYEIIVATYEDGAIMVHNACMILTTSKSLDDNLDEML